MKKNLTVSSVGDVSFSTGLEGHKYDFSDWISGEVSEFLKSDIQIGNLECVFYPKGDARPQGFNLAEQDSSAEAILVSGFDVLNLANNHICDYFGYKGIEHTIGILDKNNIHHCGAGLNLAAAQKPAIIAVNGHKVGVFGRIHEGSFDNISRDIATESSAGAAPLHLEEIITATEAAKQRFDLDLVVLCVHWGIQDTHNHTSEINKIANAIVNESDVDIILGSHSHCIQGISSSDNKVICYGQGNFYFYPQILDDGILYAEGQNLNRTSLVTKVYVNCNTKNLTVEARVVIQNEANVVVFLDAEKEAKNLALVFGKWKEYRPVAMYFEYRLRALTLDLNKLALVFRNPTVRYRFVQLLQNPKALIQKIWMTFFTGKFK